MDLHHIRIFDAHLHIIDPRFPLQRNQGYLPNAFTTGDYRSQTAMMNIVGGAVVSGSFQGFDQQYLISALQALGPGFVGVTQLPASASDEDILALDRAGVRALRFNIHRGGSETVGELEHFAQRVFELAGWHVELYVDSRQLAELRAVLQRLPAVSIDHLGLSGEGLPDLLTLVEQGIRVKATGFGRVDMDVGAVLRGIADINPDALMFGTDLPSTRARRPFVLDDVALLLDSLGDALARRVFYDNAAAFYRVKT